MRHKTEISNPLRKIRKGYRIIELEQPSLSHMLFIYYNRAAYIDIFQYIE